MSHIEPDDLAVLALDGEQPDPASTEHLAACTTCRTEYEALVRTVEFGRGERADSLEAPSASVWNAIHDELGLAEELAEDPLATPAPAVTPGGVSAVRTTTTPSRVTPLPAAEAGRTGPSRRRWWPVAVAAAVAGVVAGGAIGAVVTQLANDPERAQTVLASAALDAFPGWQASGDALLEEDADGVRSIVVDLDADVPQGEVREVWLIRSDASGLLSLGLLDGPSGRFVVPAGVDLDEFTLVDVSAEPIDGDPAHSGDSIVRGELRKS